MLRRFLFLTIFILVTSPNAALAGLVKDQIFVIDGHNRTYDLYLPNKNLQKPAPLVLLLHGHMGDADTMTGEDGKRAPYKVWLEIAEREGWILLIPDGEKGPEKHRGWNDCRQNASSNPSTDDVKFLNALVDSISGQYPVDTNRIYAHGTSNGGHMAYRLAQESTAKFKAIAAIVASMPAQNACTKPTHPISVLIMNGTEDPLSPYQGGAIGKRNSDNGKRGTVLSTEETVKFWLAHNQITSRPAEKYLPDIDTKDSSNVLIKQYRGQKDTEVILYQIWGGGHTEPSLTEHYRWLYRKIVGNQNKDIEMAEEVWKFFARH